MQVFLFDKMYRGVCLYQIECDDERYIYVGVSANPQQRLHQHQTGKGALFTQSHGCKFFKILAWFENMSEALRAEYEYVLRLRETLKDHWVAGSEFGLFS